MKNNFKSNNDSKDTYQRNLYDDVNKRKNFKENYFGDKKTNTDYITGETVHRDVKAAQNKYGSKNYTKHISDVDHIVPEKTVYERSKNNPFLTNKDIKDIANNEKNYRMATSKLNRSKGDKSNFEFIKNSNHDFTTEQKAKFMKDQISAEANITFNTTVLTTKNVTTTFAEGSSQALVYSSVYLVNSSVNNIMQVASGDKSLEDAIKDMSKETGKIAIKGGSAAVLQVALSASLSDSSQFILTGLDSSTPLGQILLVVSIVQSSLVKYINNELTGAEFFVEVQEKTVTAIAGFVGGAIGSAVLGPLGAAIGSFIASTICNEIYASLKSMKVQEKLAEEADQLASIAVAELKRQKQIIKDIAEKEKLEFNDKVDIGFAKLQEAMLNNNIETLAGGLNSILSIWGYEVPFNTAQEFDDFFDDDDSIFTL